MAVTITDIANASGYSRGTVDRALNNKARISEKTREKILKIADDMGYRPDFIARSLSRGVTMTIGVVVFDIQNRYFALLLDKIEKTAKASNYTIMIMLQENDKDLEIDVLNSLVDRKVDGIILAPANKGEEFSDMIKKLPMPVVTIGNYITEDIHNICIDEEKATIDGVKLIISKGYKKIVFVCPYLEDGKVDNIYVHEQRLNGFNEVALKHKDIDFEILNQRKEIENIYDYLDSNKRTALFCSGDMLALDVIKLLKERDIRSPRDYGIMGFDGLDILDYITPPLATIKKPIDKIGIKAFDDLKKIIDGNQEDLNEELDYYIVEGETI